MTQHASLSVERWSAFTREQQILMIANEMNRAAGLMRPHDRERLAHAYERVLRLVDLTVQAQSSSTLRRELLRWRDLIAEQYVARDPKPAAHMRAFRVLLQMHPAAARQIPSLLS